MSAVPCPKGSLKGGLMGCLKDRIKVCLKGRR
uniref:Uncharacterized protein n=1 Tax=Anguilla anguilla TaxID=7936 RepID=A0A0E9VKZ8_ANGAN